jgi:transcriptional regulator with XRE-family HTH domain
LKIRTDLGLSQDELIESLGLKGSLFSASVSQFERGVREPSYIVLLKYARLVCISTDASVKEGFRILSAYRTAKGEKICVLTEANRGLTTILLPSEY